MASHHEVPVPVLVRLDADLARAILEQAPPSVVRLAPSIRGLDLAQASAVTLSTLLTIDSYATVLVAKDHLGDFAYRFLHAARSKLRARQSNEPESHLTVELASADKRLKLELQTEDAARLADVLRAMATVVDAADVPAEGQDG